MLYFILTHMLALCLFLWVFLLMTYYLCLLYIYFRL